LTSFEGQRGASQQVLQAELLRSIGNSCLRLQVQFERLDQHLYIHTSNKRRHEQRLVKDLVNDLSQRISAVLFVEKLGSQCAGDLFQEGENQSICHFILRLADALGRGEE